MNPMSEGVIRRCPRCGRKAHDDRLVQCPDCRVPFVFEERPYNGLTPDQLRLVAAQIFGSWKFWAVLILVVGAAAWGVVVVADRVIDTRAKQYLNTLEANATNHIGTAFGQISNQIALEFRQPRIRAAIEQVARTKAGDLFTNGIRPSLDAFQDALDSAELQLARSSNALAQLEAEAIAARRRIPTNAPVVTPPPPAPAPVVQTPAPVAPATPATAPTPASVPTTVKLVLANRTVNQVGANYFLTLFFRATIIDGSSRGNVDLVAGTYNQTAKILNFAATTTSAGDSATLDDTGDVSRLKFAVTDRESPTVVLELSAPTIVRFVSDSLDADLTIPVAADKMQLLPPSSNTK